MKRWEVNGRQLRRWRCAAGLTPADLARRLEVDQGIVVGVEEGYRRFSTRDEAEAYVKKVQRVCRESLEAKQRIAAFAGA